MEEIVGKTIPEEETEVVNLDIVVKSSEFAEGIDFNGLSLRDFLREDKVESTGEADGIIQSAEECEYV